MRRRTTVSCILLLVVLVLGVAVLPAAAQTRPQNPRTLYFNDDEYAAVARFEVAFFQIGASAPVQPPIDLGKPPTRPTDCPPPTVAPCIYTTVNTQPLPFGANYVARVRAVAVVDGNAVFSDWSDEGEAAFFERVPGKPGGVAIK